MSWLLRAPRTALSWFVLVRGSRPAPRWATIAARAVLVAILAAGVLVLVLQRIVR